MQSPSCAMGRSLLRLDAHDIHLDEVPWEGIWGWYAMVVGAGPTGLLLALWLKRSGVDVRIVDRAPGPGTHLTRARRLFVSKSVTISSSPRRSQRTGPRRPTRPPSSPVAMARTRWCASCGIGFRPIGDLRALIGPHGQREDESARLFRPRSGLHLARG